jgi:hypothetical protein
MIWAGHVTCMGNMRKLQNKILSSKCEMWRTIERLRRRWEEVIKWGLKK